MITKAASKAPRQNSAKVVAINANYPYPAAWLVEPTSSTPYT